MSNLRWILLAAGVAILVFLYFTGRPKAPRQARHEDGSDIDNELGNATEGFATADTLEAADVSPTTDRYADTHLHADATPEYAQDYSGQPTQYEQTRQSTGYDGRSDLLDAGAEEYASFDETRFTESLSQSMHGDPGYGAGLDSRSDSGFDPEDFVRPAAAADDYPGSDNTQSSGHGAASQTRDAAGNGSRESTERPMRSTIGEKIEAFGAKLSPRRKNRVAASVPRDPDGRDNVGDMEADKIISLHVVTPSGQIIPGQHLLDVFESRGYRYGEMNIFHSMHNNKTLFSIAKAVEPGIFDINDVQSFDTPGVTLILQLPGPVQGDVAFEVLISEAHELANLLGCKVLDSDRSTLSKQTVQHLRESVYEYLHRQKYFQKTPS